ncbi:MAG: SBBP repeat-containing protein, partial [Deltaproteobacteria bacterium]|nr:SBBP repeat-containing protein [Deltaproteobacteria bacterium]
LYSTYLGGAANDAGHGIAVDSTGNAYVTGYTDSVNFPTLNALQGPQGGTDAFVTKLNANGSALLYSTYLGGAGNDEGLAITVSSAARAYITGFTDSNNFPLKKAFQGDQPGTDAFVTRLNPGASGISSLLYSTYLGGSGNDVGLGVAVDSESNAYVTGYTGSSDFPMLNATQSLQGGNDAFVTKVDPAAAAGSSVLYSTYLGGSGNDEGYGIALDASGNSYVTGMTESGNFPTAGGLATSLSGLQDAFVAKVVQPDLTVEVFSVPSTGGAGSSIQVSNTTKNQGAAAAEASKTKFYLSTDSVLGAADTLLGSRDIPLLAPEEASAGSTELPIPPETAAGNYYIIGKVDADNTVAEALEWNNNSKRAIQIVHGPDLIVSALSATGNGSTVTVTDTTKNQGVISANASTTKFYLSTDTSFDAGDILLGSRSIADLATGAVSAASTELGIPTGTAAGTYYVIAKADADSAVAEVNESNNTKASDSIAIRPDLIVTTVSVPATASAGSTISVTDTTKNQAVVSATASMTKFYLSTDTTLSAGDTLLGNRPIPVLAADAESTGATALTIPAGTAGGKYYILAQADADGAVAESNEGNNTTASNAFGIGPDLIITTVFAPSTAGAGSTIFVSNTTKNQGGDPAGASATKFFLSTDTNLGPSDVLLGSRAITALAPGGISVESTSLSIPAATAPGTYFIIAQADADNAIAEANEGNNTTASNAFAIGADLVVSALTAPSTAAPGSTISVTDTTKNQGGGSAGASTTRFYLSTDTSFDSGDLLLGSRTVPVLAPGAASSASTALTLPAGLAGGTYYMIAKADADNAVAEFSEDNNVTVASGAIFVGPDLAVAKVSGPSASGAGLTISVTDTTKNQGFLTTPASTTKFYLSTDTTLDAGDILLGSRTIPALAPGALDSGSTTLTIPPATATGTYSIIAKADADNAVAEIDEGNNITVASQVISIGADLIVWLDLPASAFTAPSGSTISLTDVTKNDSSAQATASTTRFYLSADTILDATDVLLGSRVVPALSPGASSSASTSLILPAGVAGNYYIIAQADADNVVAELNEGNNITVASKPIFIGADLIVWLDVPGASATLAPGSTLTLTDTTKNESSSPAGASTTRFYLSADTTLDAGDTLLGSRTIPALAAGAMNSGSTTITIPTGLAGGTYYIIAKADADNAIPEFNENNNTTASKPLIIGPDLIVWLDVPAASNYPAAGATISMTDQTKNDSFAIAGASTTKFYLSADATLDASDILLGSRAVPALAPGEISLGSTTFTLPAGVVGTYYIIAQADADNAVVETNEGNNITTSKAIPIGADLIVWMDVPGSASTVAAGSNIVVPDWTRNDNSAPAGASTTKFYLSTDTTLDAGDTLFGSRAIPALPPSTTNQGSTSLTIPAGLAGGTYYIIAKADADNAVAEFNESNNTFVFATPIRVGVDLVVWLDVPAASATIAPGSTLTLTDTTRNESSSPAGASTTKFYLSTDTTLDASDTLLGSRAISALAAGAMDSGSTTITIPTGLAGGTYYIIAKADADNAVVEINEGNNVTVSKPLVLGPDLIVWLDVPAASNYPAAGALISVTDQTKNDSFAIAGASTTKFYLSADATLDASDILLGSRAVPALAPGEINSGSTTFTLPAGIAGTNYIIAKADADNAVVETNEGNNVQAKVIHIGADLIVWMDVPGSVVIAGSSVAVPDWTRNDNSAPAGASTTKFYLSTDTILDAGDILVGSRAIPALPPSTTNQGSTSLTIPAGLAGGIYYIIAKADADNAVVEFNESNNTAVGTIRIAEPWQGSDLIVWMDLPASSYTAAPGSTISVTDITKNDGTLEAGISTTKFYLSIDTSLDAADILLGSRAVPTLAQGATSTASNTFTVPPGLGGIYYIIAKADADNAVAEIKEGNNITVYSRTIQIGPDLIVWLDVPAASATIAPGSTLALTDTTRNESSSPAGASTTKFYLSTDTMLDAGDILLGSRAIPALAAGAMDSGSTPVTIPTGLAGGTYYIIAKADADNAIAEFNEGNNVTVSKPLVIGPDLIVWLDVPAASNYPAADATISVTDQTKNDSFAIAGVSTTKFYLSTDTTLDSSDILLGSRAVPSLTPGEINSGSTTFTLPPGIAGTYYFIAKADADNAVVETNEGNNITTSKAIPIGADLIVWIDVPGSASTVAAGSNVVVPDWTRNDNSAPAGASTTKFYLSADTALDASDVVLGSRAVPALPPSTTNQGSTSLTIPAGLAGGTYYIIAKADADNAVVEINEGNNIFVFATPIRVGADLVVWLDLPGIYSAVPGGSTIFITDYTRNDSLSPASASTTRFFLSSDATLDASDIPLGSRAIPALGSGVISSGSNPLTLPAGIAGTYYILAQADADNAIAEVNEGNNVTASSPIAIGPDLVITGITAASKTGAGFTIYISDTTKNKGAGSAAASTTKFYLSADTTLDAGDLLLGSRAIPDLAPSEYNSGTKAVTISATVPAGSYYIIALADGGGVVSEANETNNTFARLIEVLPDLTVPTIAAPSKAYPNSPITVSDTTKNQGAGSPASTTTFFLSADRILDAGDTFLGSRVVPALASGATSQGVTSVTLPADLAAGTYYIIAQADADNVVAEFNENNNIRYRTLTVGPDMVVSSFSVPSTGVTGSSISVTDTTTNQGSSAGASTTKFYLSTNATLNSGDVLLGSRAVPALAVQEANSASTTLTLPSGTVPGSYYIIAQADGDKTVAELVETNNTKARAITVSSQ